MLKIGLSINQRFMNTDFYEECAKAGIGCVELSPEADYHVGLDFAKAANAARAAGLEVWTYHLPFLPFEALDVSAPKLAKASLEHTTELMRRAADAGIKNFVIHSSGEPIEDCERAIRMETAKDSLYKLAEVAKASGGRIFVENLPRTVLGKNADEVLELISVHPELRVVFDTNHLLEQNPVEFIEKVGKNIVSTHVSDYDLIDEKHWLPGEGKADFTAIYTALTRVGYDGPWLYELSTKNTKTITRSRDLTPADFVKNAKEIFAGAPITIIK